MKLPHKIRFITMLMLFSLASYIAPLKAEDTVIGTHVKKYHSNEFILKDTKAQLEIAKKQCAVLNKLASTASTPPEVRADLAKKGLPTTWTVTGDVNKFGYFTIDEYYSSDGAYKATYQHGYTMEHKACSFNFMPYEKIEIYQRTKAAKSYTQYVSQYNKNKKANVWLKGPNVYQPVEFSSLTEASAGRKATSIKDNIAGLPCDMSVDKLGAHCKWYADDKRLGRLPSNLRLMGKLGPDDELKAELVTFDIPIRKSIFAAPSNFEDPLSKLDDDLGDDEDSPEEIARCIVLNKKTGKNTCGESDE